MKQISRIALLILLVSLVYSTAWADKYSEAKQMFEKAGVSDLFNSAYGYALFPTIGKGGLIVGAAYGKGRVYEKGAYMVDRRSVSPHVESGNQIYVGCEPAQPGSPQPD